MAAPALADDVALKDGKVLKGRILNDGDKILFLKTEDGLVKVSGGEVASVVRDGPLPPLPALDPEQGPLVDAVIRVGPGGITRKEHDWYVRGQGDGAWRWLIETELLFQEALREGLHKDDYVRDRLVETYQNAGSTTQIDPRSFTEEEMRAFYKANPALFETPAQVDLRFVEVDRKTPAKELEAMASKAKSKPDSITWRELGWQKPEDLKNVLPKEALPKVFRMKPGDTLAVTCVTKVVYILRAAERKEAALPPFEEVDEKVRFEMLNAKAEAMKKALGDDKAKLYRAAIQARMLQDPQTRDYLGNCLVQKRGNPKERTAETREKVLNELWKKYPVRVMLEE